MLAAKRTNSTTVITVVGDKSPSLTMSALSSSLLSTRTRKIKELLALLLDMFAEQAD
jgi:hypothetical protein